MQTVLRTDPHLGRIFVPEEFKRMLSIPGMPTRKAIHGEVAIFTASQQRPIFHDDNRTIKKYETIWGSVSANERVDKGASIQVFRVFGTVGTSPAGVFASMAIASASLTVAAANLSLGSNSANVTTNEFTTIGLSRATATIQNYVAPASLGAVFSVDAYKQFTLSGSGTAYGAGLFDSNTVSGSFHYAAANFGSSAVLISGDTLSVTGTVSN